MAKVGIFFGTDTGTTRKVAKLIQQQLGDELADKPKNINQVSVDDFNNYDYLILGTPTIGDGELPGLDSDADEASWLEFTPQFAELDLANKKVALFGLGDQVCYEDEFVDALGELYDYVVDSGADVVGRWPLAGYDFSASNAVDGDEFVGLVIDAVNQANLTEERIAIWVEQLKAEMTL